MVYCATCALYVAAFLANVQESDEEMWIIAFVTALVEDFIVAPLIIANLLLLLLVVARCAAPGTFRSITSDLRLTDAAKSRFGTPTFGTKSQSNTESSAEISKTHLETRTLKLQMSSQPGAANVIRDRYTSIQGLNKPR